MKRSLKEEIDDIIYSNFGGKAYWGDRRNAVNCIYDTVNNFLRERCREFEIECTKVVEAEVNGKLLDRIESMRLVRPPKGASRDFEDGTRRQLSADMRHLRGLDRQNKRENDEDDDWNF